MQGAIIGAAILAILLFVAANAQAGGKKRFAFQWATNRPPNLAGLIGQAASTHGVKGSIIAAVVYVESRGNPSAINPSDPSYGIGQMMLPTARNLSGNQNLQKEDLFKPEIAVPLVGRYLSVLQSRYAAKFPLSEWLQAYNVGETKFDRGTRNPGYGAKVTSQIDGSEQFLQAGQIAEEFQKAGTDL